MNNLYFQLTTFPNPFSENIRIEFSLLDKMNLTLNVYTFQGHLIKRLTNGIKEKGKHSIIWDGSDMNGKKVAPGIYLVRLRSGKHVLSRSVEFIR